MQRDSERVRAGVLSVGLTGGIAAGKSTVAAELGRLGAVVVDADLIARDVVAPGSPGLAEITREWGNQVLAADGSLDRARLGQIVFADAGARARLGEITHPRVFDEHVRREAEAVAEDPSAVVVHDVPLIVENDAAHRYHLVLVVDAPAEDRVRRMVADRGMTEPDARARIGAQATEAERRAVADVWLDNAGTPEELRAAVRRAWEDRIRPYEANLRAGRTAARESGPDLRSPEGTVPGGTRGEGWADAGARLVSRLAHVLAEAGIEADVSHIGSTAVPVLAKDVIDLQVGVDDLDDDRPARVLAAAGFPRPRTDAWDHDHATGERLPKLFHRAADPGRAVNLHVRPTGGTAWRWALAFRDALRADPSARETYAGMKASMAAQHPDDLAAYAAAKEPWFALRGASIVRDRLATHAVLPDIDLREPPAA